MMRQKYELEEPKKEFAYPLAARDGKGRFRVTERAHLINSSTFR